MALERLRGGTGPAFLPPPLRTTLRKPRAGGVEEANDGPEPGADRSV